VSVEIRKRYFAFQVLTPSDPKSTVLQVRTVKRMKERGKKEYGDRRKVKRRNK
jgi:hypothetical protein